MSNTSPKCAAQAGGEETPGLGEKRRRIPSSPTYENQEAMITTIRAVDVTLGLRRIPAGFYAVVYHSDLEWKTENKPSSIDDDVIEWSGSIPIPSDLSAIVCLEVYASFEFQPMLGAGEQLRELTITVEQLLDRSASGIPFTFSPKDGDVGSPCSSVLVTIEQQKSKSSDTSVLRALGHRCSVTEPRDKLEHATNQGHSALSRYRKHGDKWDLECSIERFEQALSICPLDHPCLPAAQSNLAMAKFIHCQVEHADASLKVPLGLYRSALAARPIGHLDRSSTLVQLAAVHFARSEKQRDGDEGAQAEALLYEAIRLCSTESHEKRAATLMLQMYNRSGTDTVQTDGQPPLEQDSTSSLTSDDLWILCFQLHQRYTQFGDLADLQHVITLWEKLVESTSVWDALHQAALANLGAALWYRFKHLGDLNDLDDAISRLRDVLELTPRGHPNRSHCLNNLCSFIESRFERLGEPSDLQDAISMLKDALDDNPHDPFCLNTLGMSLLRRFERFGEPSDVEDAISRFRDAVDLTPDGHPDKAHRLGNLGIALKSRYEHVGELSDLEDAISIFRSAIHLVPHGDPDMPKYLNSLGNSFLRRFERFGELSDIEDAIFRFRFAVDLTPNGHPDQAHRLNNLGNSIRSRFDLLGDLSDLEDAISTLKHAIRLVPYGHPDMHSYLNSLGNSLICRFERLGELGDLEDAILKFRSAVDLIPHGHPDQAHRLNNLGISLKSRFEHFGELSDLEDAISTLRNAVRFLPYGHPDMPNNLNSLGNSLVCRFECLGELGDLEDAISRFKSAADLTPHGHPIKFHRLNNLGNAFFARFKNLRELSDLENAISWERDAINLTPHGHPLEPTLLNGLGSFLLTRFECFGELSDLEEAISLFSRAASAATGPISVRFQASQRWVSCARHMRHRTLLHACSVTISLLPQLAWIGHSLGRRYAELRQGADVVRELATVALDFGHPETAVEWLEQGRSIVWGELYQLRSSHEELSSAHPEHACKLQELSAALEHAGATREKTLSTLLERGTHHATVSLEQEADRHRMLAIERDKLLQEIRGFPGFEQFLLHKKFSQLRAAAHSGPVVILNSAKSRCDALIVLADVDHVIHVPLSELTLQRSANFQRMLERLICHVRMRSDEREGKLVTLNGVSWESFLSPLWKCIVKPVLDALALSTPGELSRIFWCPTGTFVFLPIHAAGFYHARYSSPGHKVSDFVISSYIPTLAILSLSPNHSTASGDNLRLLAVSQPPSDGQSQLPGVVIELERIKEVIRNSPSACTTLLESSDGTVEEVLSLMKKADWVHFACHGIQDAEDSGLCLADGRRLKLRDIIVLSRPHGGLAFLSACQTAMGEQGLSDEAVHIAAGMLFAGYRGVVGTMWSISDKLAPDVARGVYEQLFRNGTRPDHREAARALHETVGRLRDRNVSFVLYIQREVALWSSCPISLAALAALAAECGGPRNSELTGIVYAHEGVWKPLCRVSDELGKHQRQRVHMVFLTASSPRDGHFQTCSMHQLSPVCISIWAVGDDESPKGVIPLRAGHVRILREHGGHISSSGPLHEKMLRV